MVTSDFSPEVEIRPFRACAVHPAIIIGSVRSLWTWLWGKYHVPQNAFLVIITTLSTARERSHAELPDISILIICETSPSSFSTITLYSPTSASEKSWISNTSSPASDRLHVNLAPISILPDNNGAVVTEQRVRRRIQISGLNSTVAVDHCCSALIINDTPRGENKGFKEEVWAGRSVADYLLGWWSGVVVSALALINEVNQRRARLVLRWATVSGFNSRCRTFV